jgi:hypothetical protein
MFLSIFSRKVVCVLERITDSFCVGIGLFAKIAPPQSPCIGMRAVEMKQQGQVYSYEEHGERIGKGELPKGFPKGEFWQQLREFWQELWFSFPAYELTLFCSRCFIIRVQALQQTMKRTGRKKDDERCGI